MTTDQKVLTTKLNSGVEVLAKWSNKYGINPVTYTNYTQAEKKAAALKAMGIDCEVIGAGHVAKFVAIIN